MELINLDECVLEALKLFSEKPVPDINFEEFNGSLVVGSGNAAVTGRIMFKDNDVVFADESNYLLEAKKRKFDKCVVVSASGMKHAPIIAKKAKSMGIEVFLFTNNPHPDSAEIYSKTFVFPSNAEPYTYNTSTYLGMILSKTREDPHKILKGLLKLGKVIPKNLSEFDSFYFIIPESLDLSREMFLTKFDELFGSKISGRVFTYEQTKHAKTIIPSGKELIVSFGEKNKIFGEKRLNLNFPKRSDYGKLIIWGYYFIGQIQKQNEPWFKENIEDYMKRISKVFGENLDVMVDYSKS